MIRYTVVVPHICPGTGPQKAYFTTLYLLPGLDLSVQIFLHIWIAMTWVHRIDGFYKDVPLCNELPYTYKTAQLGDLPDFFLEYFTDSSDRHT